MVSEILNSRVYTCEENILRRNTFKKESVYVRKSCGNVPLELAVVLHISLANLIYMAGTFLIFTFSHFTNLAGP